MLLVKLDPPSGWTDDQISRVYRDLLSRIEHIPGVRCASLASPTPLSGAGASGFASAEGFTERPEDRRWISISYVAPGYFDALGTPLFAGRDFDSGDSIRQNAAIVNRAFARYYFAGRDPIGKHVTLENVTMTREAKTYEIIGVAGDANYYEIREQQSRTIFLPALARAQTFLVRTNLGASAMISDVRRIIREAQPSIPMARLMTLADQIDASIVPERLIALLSGFFGVLAGLLAGIGLYGLLSYSVARRTSEIGVRIALGESAGNVVWLITRESLGMVAAGLAVGVPLAIWGRSIAAHLIQNLPVHTTTPLVAAGFAILAIALIASYVPARRAASVDPIEAVRYE